MTLFDYYLQYMTEVWEGKRPAPEGITLPEDGDEATRIQALGRQLQAMGMAGFVRACAAQDGTVLPEELFVTESSDLGGFQVFLQGAETPEAAPERPATPDPDANKHAFEVFLDCIAMDDGLVQYLIDVLKRISLPIRRSTTPASWHKRFPLRIWTKGASMNLSWRLPY